MKKLVILLVFLLAIAHGVFASGENEGQDGPIVIKLAHSNNADEPNGLAAQKWADIANEKGQGKLKVEVYPNSQLGSQKDVMEQVLIGANIVSISDAGFLMDYVPDIGILYGPYLTDTYEEYFKIIDSNWFQNDIIPEVRKSGFEIITAKWVYGTRHILASKPVKNPNDLKGLKLRTPNVQSLVKTINYMGGVSTPLPLADVYSAVAQGVIDGAENPIPVLYGIKIYEKVKYLSLTGHIKNVSIWIGSEKFFATMNPEVKKVFLEAAEEASLFKVNAVDEDDKRYLELMKKEGVEVIQPDVEAFRKSTAPFYSELFSPELAKTVKDIVNE